MIITKKRNKSLSRKHKSKVFRVLKTKTRNSKKNKYQFYVGGSKKASQVPVPVPVPDVIQPTYNTVDPDSSSKAMIAGPLDGQLYGTVPKNSSMKASVGQTTMYSKPETGSPTEQEHTYENLQLLTGPLYPYNQEEEEEPVYGNIQPKGKAPPLPPRKRSNGVAIPPPIPAPFFPPRLPRAPEVLPHVPRRVSKLKNTKGESHF
jgi:hypothetical protein